MERPNFQQFFTKKSDFCEKSSRKPVNTFVPHQAMQLSELMARFEKGQRLNVHENFAPLSNMTRDKIYQEDFEDAPPDDVHDVVDVHEYWQEHEAHKRDYAQKKKKAKAQQAQQAQAQPAQPAEPKPVDPAA